MSLEDVKVSLAANSNLSDEFRNNIYSLVSIFHDRYPSIDLTKICNNLLTLKIEKVSKFVSKRVSKYNPKTNTLQFNIEKIEEGYDIKNVLMCEILNIMTNNGEYTGFNKNEKLRALNAGYTSILATNLVGNDSDIDSLEQEVILTNVIGYAVGADVLFDSYFNNDAVKLTSSMLEHGIEIDSILEASNYAFDASERNIREEKNINIFEGLVRRVQGISPENMERLLNYASMSGQLSLTKEEILKSSLSKKENIEGRRLA